MPNRARFQPGNFPKAGYSQNWVERRKKMSKVSHRAARNPRQARNFSFWHLFSPSQGWNWLFSEGKMGQKSPKEGSWPPFLPEKSPKPRGKTFPDPTGSRKGGILDLLGPVSGSTREDFPPGAMVLPPTRLSKSTRLGDSFSWVCPEKSPKRGFCPFSAQGHFLPSWGKISTSSSIPDSAMVPFSAENEHKSSVTGGVPPPPMSNMLCPTF